MVVAVIAAVVVIGGLVILANLRSGAGVVYFSKTAYDQSSQTCQFSTPVTTLSTADPVFMIASFNDTLQPQDTYTLEVSEDGKAPDTTTATADKKFNCYVEQTALGPLPAGTYKFTFRHNDKVEAEGTLTIK